MKSIFAVTLVALSLLSGIAAVATSANAADAFGSRQWWTGQQSQG